MYDSEAVYFLNSELIRIQEETEKDGYFFGDAVLPKKIDPSQERFMHQKVITDKISIKAFAGQRIGDMIKSIKNFHLLIRFN